MSGPIRFTLVANSITGVSETFLRGKLVALRRAGFDVAVVELSPRPGSELPPELSGVPRVPVQLGVTPTAGRMVRDLAAQSSTSARVLAEARRRYGNTKRAVAAGVVAAAVLSTEPDIVNFAFSGIAVALVDALPLLAGSHLTVSCRGAAEQIVPLVDPGRGPALAEVFGHMDLVHCVSDDMARTVEALGAPVDRIFVNRPAVDADAFRRSAPHREDREGTRLVASVGRLHWKKGLDDGVAAIRSLVESGLDVRYEIAGAGPEQERLAFLVHLWGLGDRVRLLGSLPPGEVRALVERADVFLLPSLSEGLSNAVLEAMALEAPVVTTRAGGMAEAVDDGRTGLVVPERDPLALARAVAELLANPGKAAAMGRRARAAVESDFTLDRQQRVFAERYSALVR